MTKNITKKPPAPRGRRNNNSSTVINLPLGEKQSGIINAWIGFLVKDERTALDDLARMFIEKGVRPTCPRCGGELVMDGGPGKKRYEKHPSSRQFLCKRCGKKYTFTRTREGIVATACLAARDILVAGVDFSRRLHAFGIAIAILSMERPISSRVLVIDGSVKGGIRIVGIVGEGERRFFLYRGESGEEVEDALRKVVVDGEGIVVVSDGGYGIYNGVKKALPLAIHVRSFHGEWRGTVAVHVRSEHTCHTVYTSWDVFAGGSGEFFVFSGDVASPSRAFRMAGNTRAAEELRKRLEEAAEYLVRNLDVIAEMDDGLFSGGSNRCEFERIYSRIGKELRLLPRGMRVNVIERLKAVMRRIMEGVRPLRKGRARRWRRIIERYGGFGDRELLELVRGAAMKLPPPDIKEMRRKKRKKSRVRISDRGKVVAYMGRYDSIEALKNAFPGVGKGESQGDI